MDKLTFEGLALAGTAGMRGAGGHHRGANAVLSSARARRRAFSKEADALYHAHIKAHGPIEVFPDDDEIEAFCERDPNFSTFIEGLRSLQRKWFGAFKG